MMPKIIALLVIPVISLTGAVVPIPVQVVPQRIESVNGSNTSMGCTSPLVDSGGVMVCNSTDCPSSYLLDGNSPAIDTSSSDWASQLVTVRKNDGVAGGITFDHVVLTFGFDTAVSLNSIELDLFLCPEWNIGASLIAVYGDESSDLVLSKIQSAPLGKNNSVPSQSSCDSLLTVSIPLQGSSSYFTWHIVISFGAQSDIQWVLVGEVRFQSTSADPDQTPNPLLGTTMTITQYNSALLSTLITTELTCNSTTAVKTCSTSTTMMSTKHSTTLVGPTMQPSTSTVHSESLNITLTTASHTTMESMTHSTTPVDTSMPIIHTTMESMTHSTTPVDTSTPIIQTTMEAMTHSTTPVDTSMPIIQTTVESMTHSTTPVDTSMPIIQTTMESMTHSTTPVVLPSITQTTVEPSTTLVTLALLVSSSLPSNTATNNQTPNDSITSVVAAVSGLVLALIFISVSVIIGLCFIRMRYRSKVQHKGLENITYELKDVTNEQEFDDSVTGDQHSNDSLHQALSNSDEVINASYSRRDKTTATVTDGVYSEVCSGNICPQIKDGGGDITSKTLNTQTKIIDANGDEVIGMYDVVTSANKASVKESPAQELSSQTTIMGANGDEFIGMYNVITPVVPANKSSAQESPAKASATVENVTYAHPHELDCTHTVKKEESIQPVLFYSDIQIREAPIVPAKSSDLEQYLDTRSVFNVGTHSESIKPSDFTCSKTEEEETDPVIVGPIYPPPTVLPEYCQQPVEITSDNIEVKKELGTGQFGEVVLAVTSGLSLKDMQLSKTDENQDISLLVAVKKLNPSPSQIAKEAFSMEIKFMSQLKHPSVVHLLGVCYHDPAFIMMEYMEEGDLSQFLQRHSEIVSTPSSDTQIATSTVVYMASQIADAMKHLAALNFIHRDLASRNCLIGKNNVIKIADLGVNMKLYQSNYYRIHGNKLLPIRWMATECFSGKFSEKSDVWAFGVTMWELFTLAKYKPYPHLSAEEVIHNALKREYRQFPSRPGACPQPVYEIMEQCWVVDMKQRALFKNLQIMLQMTTKFKFDS